MTDCIRILIADDHPLFRGGLSAFLRTFPNLRVVAEASTGRQAIDLATTLHPDIVLMDVRLPDMSGIEATRHILSRTAHSRIMMMTMCDDRSIVVDALTAGARGYLLKDAGEDSLIRAIEAVMHGDMIIGAGISEHVVASLKASPESDEGPLDLSTREMEILKLAAHGMSNNDIADQLVISPKTVANHVSNIMSKLEAPNRVQLVITARERGIGR